MREIFLQCFAFLLFMVVAAPQELAGRTNTEWTENDYFLPPLTFLNLPDTLLFDLNDCAGMAEVCMGIPIDDISNYQITANGQAYVNGIAGCDNDTSNVYSYTNLFGQGTIGPYILQSWSIDGSTFSTPFNNIGELVDSMNVWDPLGNWVLNPVDQTISGGFSGFVYSDMSIFALAIGVENILIRSDLITPQGTRIFINSGTTQLIVTESATGVSDTALIATSCVQTETLNLGNVFIGNSEVTCLDFSELPGAISTVANLCPSSKVDFQPVNMDSCIMYTGVSVGTDTACIVACDVFGFCDTTYLIVSALSQLGVQELFDTIFVGESVQWCADISIFPGNVDTIYNSCEDISGTYVNFVIDEANYCVNYTGIGGLGTEEGCFIVCDDMNNCDTTIWSVTVRDTGPNFFFDTLYINETETFCDWDTDNLFGMPVNIENGCIGSSGSEVFFDVDQANICLDYEAIGAGKDTACIYLTDGTGAIDTTFAIVCVLLPDPEIITDNIRLTTNPVYCVDTTQLAGTIVSIENICPEDSGEAIDFLIDSVNYCVQANPLMLGTDSICIVICDDFGICDTTTFIITVDDDISSNIPDAVDDIDSTAQNTSLLIDACFNDIIPPDFDITNFFVLPVASGGIGPNNGTAFSNVDCTISYVPNDDFCGLDQITYVLCNTMGCDTATVTINVICPPSSFQIFNAFSPNGDGVNEYFRITGLEQFPDHTLYVFNRWGNSVLEVSNYQNDWNGTWQGFDLPDGTYFYVFDTGEGEVSSGYVYIGR